MTICPSLLYCTSEFAGLKFALICKSYGIVSQMHSEPDYPLSSITYPPLLVLLIAIALVVNISNCQDHGSHCL